MATLLEASDAFAPNIAASSSVAPMIVLPTAEAYEAVDGGQALSGGQRSVTVEKILADTLQGGAGDVDAILAGIPSHGISENAALGALASANGEGVSGWDTGAAGHLSATILTNIVADMTAFHHDAVQPAING